VSTKILAGPLALAVSLGVAAAPAAAQAIPDNPSKLTFKPIAFDPPRPADHRVVLKNGMVVFIAEDKTLPLVNIGLTVRTGSYLEPAGKEGLAALTGSQMRRGGTKSLTAEQLDERLDFLAANVGTGIGDTAGTASLNALSDNLDESLRLFVEVLKEPRFQEDRLALAKEQALQDMKKRNDDPADIERVEWNALLYGEGHFTNRFVTEASLKAITRDDLVQFHRKYFHPANMIAAVSGSFDRATMIAKLEQAFANWPWARPTVPPIPADIQTAKPGLYRIQKDVPQGRVTMGLPSVRRNSPDIYALEVMNEILGGSGFTSRITRTVRSNEGLAYSAGSGLRFGIWYPGSFRVVFQSKSRSVPYALSLVAEEIKRIREQPVTEEEIDTIKKSLIETFPSSFASKAQAMAVFASDEYTGRDPSYWTTYRDKIRAVTAADVQRVARTYLDPDKMVILMVGNQTDIDVGDEKHPVSLPALAGSRVTVLPLRDPMTMKRPSS
jgi:predicted Zn-dependent peptidase